MRILLVLSRIHTNNIKQMFSLSGRYIYYRYLFLTKVSKSLCITWSSVMNTNQKSTKKLGILPLCSEVILYDEKCIMQDCSGQYDYSLLHNKSKRLSRLISNLCGSRSSSTVGIFCSHNLLTILTVWASWISGQKVLLLDRNLPSNDLRSLTKETKARLMISSDLFEKQSKKLSSESEIPLIHIGSTFLCNHFKREMPNNIETLNKGFHNEALIAYNKENVTKTILITHEELCAKNEQVLKSWTLTENAKILYMCPSFQQYNEEFIFLLYFSLCLRSQINMLDPCDSKAAWRTILSINVPTKNRPNVLIAEPKVYQQLLDEYENIFAGDKAVKERIRLYCLHNFRFMLCFYNADHKILSDWYKVTGIYLQKLHFSV